MQSLSTLTFYLQIPVCRDNDITVTLQYSNKLIGSSANINSQWNSYMPLFSMTNNLPFLRVSFSHVHHDHEVCSSVHASQCFAVVGIYWCNLISSCSHCRARVSISLPQYQWENPVEIDILSKMNPEWAHAQWHALSQVWALRPEN